MKFQTKISLLTLATIIVFTAQAQTYKAELGYINSKQAGSNFSTTYFNGVQLGATVEFKLKQNFSLLSGALYSMVYSDKVQYYTTNDSVNYSTYGHYIDVPIQLKYTLPTGKNMKVFGYAGPNINIGLAQPRTTTAVLSTTMFNTIKELTGNEIVSGNDDLYKRAIYNRMNFQLGVGGGIQWKNYILKGGYNFGINSINKVDTNKLHQSGWHVSLAFEF